MTSTGSVRLEICDIEGQQLFSSRSKKENMAQYEA